MSNGPFIGSGGELTWKDDSGLVHRDDGPAEIFPNNNRYWWQHGKIHREDGPAVIHDDGTMTWVLNGNSCSFEFWCGCLEKTEEEIVQLKLQYF